MHLFFSIGSKAQIDFERNVFQKFNITTFTFDPTIPPAKIDYMNSIDFINFNEFGLTGEDDLDMALQSLNKVANISSNAKMMNIEGIMSALNHTYIHLLKIDCEGCERSFLKNLEFITTRDKPLFGQLLIEIHR